MEPDMTNDGFEETRRILDEEVEETDMIQRGINNMTRSFANLDIEQKLRENGMWK